EADKVDLTSALEKLETISPIGVRLLRLINDNKSTIKDLGDVIKLDPTLAAHLLRVVNSPYYALLNRVERIDNAVVLVGMNNLRNMIAVATMKTVLASDSCDQGFSSKALWFHCAAVAICAKMISERIFGLLGEDAFLCGLLHDIGMIVEFETVPELFLKACRSYDPQAGPFTDCEQKNIEGGDHCETGLLLAESWQLPEAIQGAIRDHHDLSGKVSPSDMSGLIQIANYLVTNMGHASLPAMKLNLAPSLRAHLHANRDEYKALIKEMPAELLKAREIYDIKES
ncbi:MAG: HDOD domain-containing protein, partial [Pseudomonadota bacterium]